MAGVERETGAGLNEAREMAAGLLAGAGQRARAIVAEAEAEAAAVEARTRRVVEEARAAAAEIVEAAEADARQMADGAEDAIRRRRAVADGEAQAKVREAEARAAEIVAESEADASRLRHAAGREVVRRRELAEEAARVVLTDAQERADGLVTRAQAEAKDRLAEATRDARNRIEEAEREAARVVDAARQQARRLLDEAGAASLDGDVARALLTALVRTLRDPALVVKDLAEALLAEDLGSGADGAGIRTLTQRIGEQATTLAAAMSAVVEVTRALAGAADLDVEAVLLKRVLDRALETASGSLGRRRVSVSVDDLAVVAVDPRAIDRALSALVDNAASFSEPDAVVRVNGRVGRAGELLATAGESAPSALEGQDLWALVTVSDDGPGIARAELEAVFEPFYRGGGRVPSPPRMGLGLTVARAIVTGHGGHLWVDSAVDVGSTFYVALPLAEPPPA